jgi:hypothetical protein
MTAITLEAQHREMLHAHQAGEVHRFLAMADEYLLIRPQDHHVRLLATKAYLALGLLDLGKEMLDETLQGISLPSELHTIRNQINALPDGGSKPWSATSDRWQANIEALAARGLDTEVLRRAWQDHGSRFRLYQEKGGQMHVRWQTPDNVWRWFPTFANHVVEEGRRPLPDDHGRDRPGPYLIEGLGLGGFVARLHEASQRTFLTYSCPLFLVEPNAALVAVALQLRDWSAILGDPRVYLATGPQWAEELCTCWDDDLDLPFPTRLITISRTDQTLNPTVLEVVEQASQRRACRAEQSLADLERRYEGRDAAYWAKRYQTALSGGGAPLRILSAVSRHTTFLQYSLRDAQRALEALGHQCVVLTEQSDHTTTGVLSIHRAVRELDPDLFLALDHLRPEFGMAMPAALPILTWDQDQLPHVITKENLAKVAPHDFLVGCSKPACMDQGLPAGQYLAARLPTCPEQFGGPPLTDEESQRYGCDFSYVSHASQTPRAFHDQERSRIGDPRLLQLFDTLFERLPELLTTHYVATGAVIADLIESSCHACGITSVDDETRRWLSVWYLWRLGDRLFRHQALGWVADWAQQNGHSLRIYGNGWDRHPTLSRFAAGPAANGRELVCIYRASKINLQLIPAGFIHQRALDGLAAGGFFLTRANPQELRGSTVAPLLERVRSLGIESSRDLLTREDAELRKRLEAHYGELLGSLNPDDPNVLRHLQIAGELPLAPEVFDDFSAVAFHSPETFAAAANRFLHDDRARTDITTRMRDIVLERFSYRATLAQFLRAMTNHLTQAAAEIGAQHPTAV